MRQRAPALSFVLLALSGCWSTDPDYVAMTRPTECDNRSRLVRRGYPENLDAVLAGSCTVTRMDPMRGPDFTLWLNGASSAIMTCDSPVPIWFWTEKSPEGKITKVHFCPEYCESLRRMLEEQIAQDLICAEEPAPPTAGVTVPPNPVPAPGAGTPAVNPMAGSGGIAAVSGGSGSAAGGAGTLPGAAGTAAGSGGASGAGGAAVAGASGAPAAGASGATAVGGTSGAGGTGGS